MNHLVSITVSRKDAEEILRLIELAPQPPLDEEDMVIYRLKRATEDAIAFDDAVYDPGDE